MNDISETTHPTSPEPPISTVPALPPTTDENIVYVPNTLEGQITLANLEFLDEYNDHKSPIYQGLTRLLEDDIKRALFPRSSSDNVYVKVMNLK